MLIQDLDEKFSKEMRNSEKIEVIEMKSLQIKFKTV
jgi:hypothetical protein